MNLREINKLAYIEPEKILQIFEKHNRFMPCRCEGCKLIKIQLNTMYSKRGRSRYNFKEYAYEIINTIGVSKLYNIMHKPNYA